MPTLRLEWQKEKVVLPELVGHITLYYSTHCPTGLFEIVEIIYICIFQYGSH